MTKRIAAFVGIATGVLLLLLSTYIANVAISAVLGLASVAILVASVNLAIKNTPTPQVSDGVSGQGQLGGRWEWILRAGIALSGVSLTVIFIMHSNISGRPDAPWILPVSCVSFAIGVAMIAVFIRLSSR